MARTVTVEDAEGVPFRCTRQQWERLHAPKGWKLVADENGEPPRKTRTKNTDTGD